LALDNGFDDGRVVAPEVHKDVGDAILPQSLEEGERCCVAVLFVSLGIIYATLDSRTPCLLSQSRQVVTLDWRFQVYRGVKQSEDKADSLRRYNDCCVPP
jgi:hypothetical protein